MFKRPDGAWNVYLGERCPAGSAKSAVASPRVVINLSWEGTCDLKDSSLGLSHRSPRLGSIVTWL